MRTKSNSWRDEKVMSRKEFNRDYMVRYRLLRPVFCRYNILVGYDKLASLLGCDEKVGFELFYTLLKKARYYSFRRGDKVVFHPFHGVEVTFIAH